MNDLILKKYVSVSGKIHNAVDALKQTIRPNNGLEDSGEFMIDKVGGMVIIVVILGIVFLATKFIIGDAETGKGALGSVNSKIQDFFK